MIEVREISKDTLDRVNVILKGIGNGSGAFHAIGAAMKRAAQSGKTQAGYYASRTYAISKGQFMAKTKISTKLSGDHNGVTNVEILFAGGVIPLIEFGGTKAGPGGVTAGPKLGGGVIRSAFLSRLGQINDENIYERVSRKRFPLEKKYGPSTGHMMQDEGVSEELTNHMIGVFDSRIEHEISRILGLY